MILHYGNTKIKINPITDIILYSRLNYEIKAHRTRSGRFYFYEQINSINLINGLTSEYTLEVIKAYYSDNDLSCYVKKEACEYAFKIKLK